MAGRVPERGRRVALVATTRRPRLRRPAGVHVVRVMRRRAERPSPAERGRRRRPGLGPACPPPAHPPQDLRPPTTWSRTAYRDSDVVIGGGCLVLRRVSDDAVPGVRPGGVGGVEKVAINNTGAERLEDASI